MKENIKRFFEGNDNTVSVNEHDGTIFVTVKDSGLVSLEAIEELDGVESAQWQRNKI